MQTYYMKILRVREYIAKRLKDASVSKVEIERAANRINVTDSHC